MTKIIACSMMVIMILSSAAVFAEDTRKEEDTIFDLIAVRPLGLVTLSIGAAFFIVSLPVGVVSGSTGKAEKALVADPFNYTFTRPLGEFGDSVQHMDLQSNQDKNGS